MRKIRDSSEDEMIAVYVQTEANSSHFRADIEAYAQQELLDPRILHMPDWRNAQENASRRAILGVHRGSGKQEENGITSLIPPKNNQSHHIQHYL